MRGGGRTVEFAFEFGEDDGDCGGGAGGGGGEVHEAGARASEVRLFRVGRVDDRLRVGDAVDRREHAAHDAELLMHDLDERPEAVGRARGSRHDAVLRGVVLVLDSERL